MKPAILIFGGTFDPPHMAHTQLPPLAAKQLGCNHIIYIPAALNPLKADTPPTSADHRLAMLQLAIQPIKNATISTIEIERPGPSFMVDTLEHLRRELGEDTRLHLLIGCDQALEFHRWKNWQRILELATPTVMVRPPWERTSFEAALRERYEPEETEQWLKWTLDLPQIDVNATEIRRKLAQHEDVSDLLDRHVLDYIARHGLYQTQTP